MNQTVPMPADAATDERPSFGERLTFASGEFASNCAWIMVTGFLLYYYTDVAYLPVAATGTLMLVSRVLDAVADPVIGILVDRTRTRWGQARPYLLFAAIPFGVLCVLTFAVPDWSPAGKVAYAYLTFTLLGLLYSLLFIPFCAMQPMMARDPRDVVQIGSMRAMATSLGSILVYGLTVPIVGLAGPNNRAGGFTLAAGFFAALTVALYYLVYFRCRERFASTQSTLGRSVGADLRLLVRNRTWLVIFAYSFITFVRLGSMVSVAAYFCINVLKDATMMSKMLPLLSVAILTGGMLSGVLLRRWGTRAVNLVAIGLAGSIYIVLPAFEHRTGLFLALFMAANVVGGIIGATVFIGINRAVEEHEALFGLRSEGLLSSSISFGMKVGMAIGIAGTAFLLDLAGYDPHNVTPRATEAIAHIFYWVPIGLIALQMLAITGYRERLPAPAGR